MKERIDKIVQEGNWEFGKLLKLNDVCNELAIQMYNELTPAEILELVWESMVSEDETMGYRISVMCRDILKDEFIASFQKCFETATVSFKSPAKDLTADNAITEDQPPLPKEKKDKPKKERKTTKGEDGIDMPKGVKRV